MRDPLQLSANLSLVFDHNAPRETRRAGVRWWLPPYLRHRKWRLHMFTLQRSAEKSPGHLIIFVLQRSEINKSDTDWGNSQLSQLTDTDIILGMKEVDIVVNLCI
jgi:hypothetical protein